MYRSVASSIGSAAHRILPQGIPLSKDAWANRHRVILGILWAHVAVIPLFAVIRGETALHGLLEGGLVAAAAVAASWRSLPSRVRAIASAVGLLSASGVLVHLSGGLIELHFHFFVMVAIITLYQDWTTFAAAILFVAAHHGIIGVLAPRDVFNHEAAWASPFRWALIHAVFVLAASAAQIVSWRFVEDQYRRAESEIRAREARFRALIENSADGITVIAADGTITYDSPAAGAGGATDRHVPGEPGRRALDSLHPEDLEAATTILSDMVRGELTGTVALELRVRHHDGTWRWLEARVTNLLHEPAIQGIVANHRDITERKALETRLAHQAFHDPLTGLANRALLADRVGHALATHTRGAGHVAVLYLDIDDFKTVNDALGHGAGDQALQVMATRLEGCVRAGDTCARLGGDEFAVLLEGIRNPGDAFDVGAKILEVFAEPVDIQGSSVHLAASLGIVVSEPGDDTESLLRNADLAMYRAKHQGKGRYEIFEIGMHDAVVERLALKADLRRAVDAGEFVAHYQPIVDLTTGHVIGAEALARWEHPTRGLLAPAAFVDLAEETGMIVPLGLTILHQACEAAAGWDTGHDLTVSVNLSARQLQSPTLVADVARILRETALPARRLTLEITESVLIDDPEAATSTLAALKQLGVSLALDDFGTGYSSLSYLGRFPVDRLKIDKSFVDAMARPGHDGDVSLIAAIAGIGELLQLAVTAEGIEHPEQVADLVAMGCRFGQGYHFARPLPLDEFEALVGTGLHAAALA